MARKGKREQAIFSFSDLLIKQARQWLSKKGSSLTLNEIKSVFATACASETRLMGSDYKSPRKDLFPISLNFYSAISRDPYLVIELMAYNRKSLLRYLGKLGSRTKAAKVILYCMHNQYLLKQDGKFLPVDNGEQRGKLIPIKDATAGEIAQALNVTMDDVKKAVRELWG